MADEEPHFEGESSADAIKVILLGDSAVGKSKLVERFLMGGFQPQQLSTYALTLFRHEAVVPGIGDQEGQQVPVDVDFWDTAGQERFNSMHPSYYHNAHCCIMVFDVGRKSTYKSLGNWYKELRNFCPKIPVIVCANKVDLNYEVTKKPFNFPAKHNLPLEFSSAADGTNVVQLFQRAIEMGYGYKLDPPGDDFMQDVLSLLAEDDLGEEKDDLKLKENLANPEDWGAP
jgi:Rab-like protein 2